MENFHSIQNDLEKYVYMIALQDRNESLFYKVIIDEIETMMPIIYTPVVGQACQKYGKIYRQPRGIFLSKNDKDRMINTLRNWEDNDIEIIVVTDGERILGLGDLGAQGMGIPVGKLSLYISCAGINPRKCLPIMIDLGTDNEDLLNNPFYLGLKENRLRGRGYDDFIDEFMESVKVVFPNALVQFEDFANANAARLLNKYRKDFKMFNDDIQGTAAVALSGIISSEYLTNRKINDEIILFYGAGTAGIGIANLYVAAMVRMGFSRADAIRRCWLIDSSGLIVSSRGNLSNEKKVYAKDISPIKDIAAIVKKIRPTTLIGTSGQPQTFTKEVLNEMARINKKPVVFALSNPTSKSECTAEQAYSWTEERCIFSSGSPFDPVEINKKTYFSGQANNAYIFPGVGLGVSISKSKTISESFFLEAALALSKCVSENDLDLGKIYPSLNKIRIVSKNIAIAVSKQAIKEGLSDVEESKIESIIDKSMYTANYKSHE